MGDHWTLQDAKNKFSAVVEPARRGVPQHVMKRGVEAVVVPSAGEYDRLIKLEAKLEKTFVKQLLSFPKRPEGAQDLFDRTEHLTLEMRDIDFGD